jgi:tetratricopeptide (TPR) repeat protein
MNEGMGGTHWAPGVAVLLLVGLGALIFVLRHWRASNPAPEKKTDDALANLDRRVQMLLDQLRELSADRHQMDETRFAADKARLEGEAANALKARDEYTHNPVARAQAAAAQAAVAKAPAPKGFFGEHPQLVGAFWGGGVVLFFVVLGIVLGREEKPRVDMEKPAAARGPMQQAPPPAVPQAPADDDKELKEAMARLAQHPEDLDLASHVGHELIRRQRFEEADRLTEQSLGFDPFHVESRIHRAILKTTHGATEQAVHELEHLAITYPHSEEARLFLGGLRMDLGDHRGALEAFERYVVEAPPDDVPPQLPQIIGQLHAELGTQR